VVGARTGAVGPEASGFGADPPEPVGPGAGAGGLDLLVVEVGVPVIGAAAEGKSIPRDALRGLGLEPPLPTTQKVLESIFHQERHRNSYQGR
jgi:hypothetical protein